MRNQKVTHYAKRHQTSLALADPGRRQILMMVAEQKRSINAIAENFEISRPAISKHIKVLEQAGFINIEEKGRERYCVLNQAGFNEVREWIAYFENYWKDQFKSLENFLQTQYEEKNNSVIK